MFTVRVDPIALLGELTDIQQKQVPFAVSQALNRTANLAQTAEREHITAAFKLRRSAFILRGIKINKIDRATKSSWCVIISVDQQVDFLIRDEEGIDHVPGMGHGKWLWKPNRDVFGDKIIMRTDALHPSNLKFNSRMQAPNGIFMVRPTKGTSGPVVLQRMSRSGKGVTQALGDDLGGEGTYVVCHDGGSRKGLCGCLVSDPAPPRPSVREPDTIRLGPAGTTGLSLPRRRPSRAFRVGTSGIC